MNATMSREEDQTILSKSENFTRSQDQIEASLQFQQIENRKQEQLDVLAKSLASSLDRSPPASAAKKKEEAHEPQEAERP